MADVLTADLRVCIARRRAVRMAFWDYKEGTHLTLPCDDDVGNLCPNPTRKQGAFSIGIVARCLSKQLASSLPLKDGCRKLVSVAAPKDIRLYLQVSLNVLRLMRRLEVSQDMHV